MTLERRRRADFHVHVDGVDTEAAQRIIHDAQSRDVGAIALLERNTVTPSMMYAVEHAQSIGMRAYPGVEIDASLDDQKIGFVALGFDPSLPVIQEWITPDAKISDRKRRVQASISYLSSQGLTLAGIPEEGQRILERVEDGVIPAIGIELGKIFSSIPQNEQVIASLKAEHASAWKEVLRRYGDQPAYTDSLDARFIYFAFFEQGKDLAFNHSPANTVIDRIHAAGGVVLYSPEGSFDPRVFEGLQKVGVDGVMAWHATKLGIHSSLQEGTSSHVDIPTKTLASIHKSGLLVLGGSDAQGKTFESGIGIGDMFISEKRADELDQRIRSIRDANTLIAV